MHVLQVFGVVSARLNADKADSESPRSAFKPGREEARCAHVSDRGYKLPSQATARALEVDLVGRLAKFFPDATPVRIPIKLSRSASNNDEGNAGKGAVFLQNTVIEFGTPREVLFAVTQPLEFADRVIVESNDASLCAEASVVAVQYRAERTVVAARFVKDVPNWIVKL